MCKLHVDSVLKSFDTHQVLTDVFISCEKGEIVGLLGRNGCGKSTLLKIIFGSIPADNRFVRVDDVVLDGLSAARSTIKYLPQNGFLPSHAKVKTLIDLFCSKEGATIVKQHELVKPLLNRRRTQLSGGEVRILEILMVVYADSAFSFIDEPFNGVAPVYRDSIKAEIKAQSKHKGFIITDHDYRSIMDIATRIVVICDGGTKTVQTIDDLRDYGYLPDVNE